MDRRGALAFVRRHGVVLESARGAEPSLAAAVAGAPVSGSWWGHPAGRAIFARIQDVRGSADVLVCTLAGGRVTYVHRRLWPAFVRLADRFPAGALDLVEEEHTERGSHRRRVLPFPAWVPEDVRAAAEALSDARARDVVGTWLERHGTA